VNIFSSQALDPHYRSGVAKTIARFAKHSQFIATTFRPELLKEAIRFIGVGYNKKTKVLWNFVTRKNNQLKMCFNYLEKFR